MADLGRNKKMEKQTLNTIHATKSLMSQVKASDKCQKEKWKTVNGEDKLWAMSTLDFENYLEPLKLYLARYRESLCNGVMPSSKSKKPVSRTFILRKPGGCS
ncbi:NF-YB1 [Raphanus sativus]|nr:NF-YB1 [Raphanus sativus]